VNGSRACYGQFPWQVGHLFLDLRRIDGRMNRFFSGEIRERKFYLAKPYGGIKKFRIYRVNAPKLNGLSY
jgi:hypothetical protein